MQAPDALQVPVPPEQFAPVFGTVLQVVAGGASHVLIVHSLPSSQDAFGSACALQSAEMHSPAPSQNAGCATGPADPLAHATPPVTSTLSQTATPVESLQLFAVQSLPSSQKSGPAA